MSPRGYASDWREGDYFQPASDRVDLTAPQTLAATSPEAGPMRRREMPEPDYAGGDGPGFLVFLMGTVAVVIVFVLIKSCLWGG